MTLEFESSETLMGDEITGLSTSDLSFWPGGGGFKY